MQSICIDRIEENIAVCQDEKGNWLEISIALLPMNSKEGDWLLFDGASYVFDEERTKKQREKNAALFYRLKKRRKTDG